MRAGGLQKWPQVWRPPHEKRSAGLGGTRPARAGRPNITAKSITNGSHRVHAKTASEILRENQIVTKSTAVGRYYTTCPQCSPKRKRAHQKLQCLGVTIGNEGLKFGCNHCGWTGGAKYGCSRV